MKTKEDKLRQAIINLRKTLRYLDDGLNTIDDNILCNSYYHIEDGITYIKNNNVKEDFNKYFDKILEIGKDISE